MAFPQTRLRRLRRTEALRRFVAETRLTVQNLVYPLFVVPGEGVRKEISSMPGVFNLSVDELVKECREVKELGLPAVILFGIPEAKDEAGSGACAEDGIVQRAARALKKEVPELLVITDVCLCEYTSHGHCGKVEGGEIVNDPSLELLAKTALSQARAGADMVAPSDMMDGRVAAIRQALDVNGFSHIPILSYAAKYASVFYGPFRDAAQSTHQMDPANADEALREVALDIEEGADIIMIKPALPYLDVIRRVRERFNVPVAAYQVSGEYSMIQAAARLGWLDRERAMMETVTAIQRAGAQIILTYFAKELARKLGC